MLGAASIPMSAIPIAGDITGLAADAAMYSAYPEERTMGNYAMSALGVLPLVPGAAALRAARGTASPLEGVVDAPQEAVMQRPANPDDYEITFHRSNEPSAFTVLPRYRQGGAEFDGVFAGPRAGMYGDFTHAFVVPKAKILRHYDLKYDVPYEDYQKAVRAVHPEWDDEQIERAFDYVTEDKNIIDQDPEDYADLFKGDSATASNLAQGLRGAVARNLGYDAVEMLDETGTSLQILSGARSMPLPKDMTFDDATREIYESLKNPNNLSTPSPSPLEGAMDMSTDARMGMAAEQGFNTNRPLYHVTNASFDAFEIPENRFRKYGKGVYTSPNPNYVDRYIRENRDIESGYKEGANVMPLYARGNLASEKDWEAARQEMMSEGAAPPGHNRQQEEIQRRLKGKGFDGLNMFGNEIIIFDPSNIRSVNAAFDPAKRGSANILATAAGGTISLSALRQLMPQEEERPIE
jgi:hypothetical protein